MKTRANKSGRLMGHGAVWARRLAAVLAMLMLMTPAMGWAQDDEEEKEDVAIGDPAEDAKLQTKAPTLEGEKKGTEVITAETFVKERKYESMKKLDEQIQKMKKLLSITPKDHPDRPEFLFNLAELYFEKSKYYQIKAYETQDKCYALEESGAEQRKIDGCKLRMKEELKEATALRKDSVDIYKEIIGGYGDFKNMDEVLFYLGSGYMELGERTNALAIYKRLIANYPQSRFVPDVLVAFGDYAFDGDDMQQALKAYDKVTDSYKDSAVFGYAMYKKGWCHFNLDDKKLALEYFLKTLKFAKKRSDLPNSKPLLKQVKKDIVMTYAFVGAASKAIGFFQKVTDNEREEWLGMGERLAIFYSDKGKFDESMSMYRELIKLNKTSVKVVDYQYEIARNQTARNAYSKETVKELARLVKLVQLADEGKFKDYQEERFNYKAKRAKVEEFSRNWAMTYHREAQQTKNPDLYAKAYFLYKEYIAAFADSTDKKNAYKMTFFYGELLYKLEKYDESAVAYEKALSISPEGKYTEEIVHSAVLAYFKLVSVEESKTQTNVDDLNAEPGEEKKTEKYKPPTPREIPDLHKRLVNACERYMKYAPDGKKIVDVKYTRARVFYDFDHLKEAAGAFKDVAWKHSDHRLAVIAANLHLDALYAQRDLETMEAEILAYLGEEDKPGPIEDEVFIEEVTAMAAAISFKKCTVYDDEEQWKKAADCFVAFVRRYPESEYGDDALYNAALDFERMSEIGKAIQVRVFLLKQFGDSTPHAPITLYNIAANYHALAIYSQAAKFYEKFVKYFPEHEKAEDALKNASTFRYGLAQYDRAIENYENYLDLFGKKNPSQGATVHFQIALSYEKQNKARAAFEQYEDYLRKWAKHGSDDQRLQAHVKLGLFYWDKKGKKNRSKALSEFKRTIKEYNKLSDGDKKKMSKGLDAAAQAQFMIGEDVFQTLEKMVVDSKNEKELQKRIVKKQEKGAEAIKIFESVFNFGRPDWTIASFFRIGDAYENFANSLRSTSCPKRLTYDQCEIYKGLLEDAATNIEIESVKFYVKALEASKASRWFNKYTKEAEVRLASLRPREYRKPSEFRAEPNHIQSGFSGIDFLKEIKDEDRLEDLDAGSGDSGDDEPAEAQ